MPGNESKKYRYYLIMGQTLPLARACAAAIKLQCALLLLFVLRNFISWCVPLHHFNRIHTSRNREKRETTVAARRFEPLPDDPLSLFSLSLLARTRAGTLPLRVFSRVHSQCLSNAPIFTPTCSLVIPPLPIENTETLLAWQSLPSPESLLSLIQRYRNRFGLCRLRNLAHNLGIPFCNTLMCWKLGNTSGVIRKTRLRGTWVGSVFPVDKAIVFHRYVAWTMGLFSTIHMYVILSARVTLLFGSESICRPMKHRSCESEWFGKVISYPFLSV